MAALAASPDPVITWYDGSARVELSGRTLADWVARTARLMTEEGLGGQDVVDLHLLRERPCHWMGAVWLLACWWAGPLPSLGLSAATMTVRGPHDADPGSGASAPVLVQCGLSALGGPCPDLAPGAVDHADALGLPEDLPTPTPRPDDQPWWCDGQGRTLTGANLAATTPSNAPVLVPASPEVAARLAPLLAAAVLGGGSLVLVEGLPPGHDLTSLATQEGAVGAPPGNRRAAP